MTTALDIRAKVYCSLGPVLSGSLADTYAQGAGLIFTRGSVEIAAVIRPAPGTPVEFAYQAGGYIARVPRHVVVLSSFADPFRGKTTVQLGCLFTYLENRKKPPENPNSKEENDVPCNVYQKANLGISASFVAAQIFGGLGLDGIIAPLSNHFSVEEFDLSAGYLSVLGDLYQSEGYIGYMTLDGTATYTDLNGGVQSGPVLTASDIIEVGPIGVGELSADNVLVRYNTRRLKEPLDDDSPEAETEQQQRSWEWDETIGADSVASVNYIDPVTEEEEVINAIYKPYSFSATTYDQWDRSVMRVTMSRAIVAETNSRYASALYMYGTDTQVGVASLLFIPTANVQVTRWTYKVPAQGGKTEIDLYTLLRNGGAEAVKQALNNADAEDTGPAADCIAPADEDINIVEREVTANYITEIELAGTLNLDDYSYQVSEISESRRSIELGNVADILDSITVITYGKNEASGITKTNSETKTIISKTTVGQQDLATKAKNRLDAEGDIGYPFWIFDLLKEAKKTKTTGVEMRIRAERNFGLQKRPSQAERNNIVNTKEDPSEQVTEFEWSVGSESTSFIEFTVPYSSDDRISWNSSTGYSSTPSDAKQKAINYGRIQNRLLMGNRTGMSLQIPIQYLPPRPLGTIYIAQGGAVGMYLTNGVSITFDSNGIIASVDALFWGGLSQGGA